MPIELHSVAVLKKMGDSLGTFLKMDIRAIEQNRMRFAKILVLLDLMNPLKENIWVGSFKQKLDYSEIPLFCTGCNSIGHSAHLSQKTKSVNFR